MNDNEHLKIFLNPLGIRSYNGRPARRRTIRAHI